MKPATTLLIILSILAGTFMQKQAFSQVPEKMSYQAVVRNAGDELVRNKTVGMQISILQGSASGPAVYMETHVQATNANGLVTIEIGGGTPVSGTFAGIDWSTGVYFLKTETDPTGGTNYSITGTSQILSVSYALYAKSAANGFSGNYNDLINKPTLLNNSLWTTATGYMTLTSNTGESNTAYGWQALYLNTNGMKNTATGIQALWDNESGFNNTANGAWALMHNKTGNSNTAVGYNSLVANTSGYSNNAHGAWALYSNSIGYHNTAMGVSALYSNEDGIDNTAVGVDALFSNKAGKNNTALGFFAGNSNIQGCNNVFIGSSSGYYETGSNKLYIDNQPRASESDAWEKSLIYGIFDADPANQILTINGIVNVRNNKIINVADPVNNNDAANKAYVDALISQLNSKGVIVADADGNIYSTVRIGSQVWMAENLKTTKYSDGTAIPNVTGNNEWVALTTGAFADYNNNPSNSATYGRLYNYYAVIDARKLCPGGWHVPTDAEWTTLINYLGGFDLAGGKLKEIGTTHWSTPNIADNTTGFTALPGGCRYFDGNFSQVGIWGYWWSATEYDASIALHRSIYYRDADVGRGGVSKEYGFSVRCVRD